MRIRYSKEADAIYIRLRENEISNSDEINEDMIVDYDKDGYIVAIEILSASEKTDMQQLVIQAFESVMVEKSAVPA
jgi:uncharacterized protein YuzE